MSHQSDLISTDIDTYLAQHEQKELLRLLTCGSVDDGKSTLIGRLLHDSKMIYEDQLASVRTDSAKHGRSEEHTSELQSRGHLVCRLLLEKKKYTSKFYDERE